MPIPGGLAFVLGGLLGRGLHRRMDSVVRQIQEERLVLVGLDKLNRRIGKA